MISQMVDNILQEGQEVGFSSGEDGDLSGDEVKAPIFVIKKDQEESKERNNGATSMEDDEDIDSEFNDYNAQINNGYSLW